MERARRSRLWCEAFLLTNNYYPVNVGQLKSVAKPFYDRLIEEDYANLYPWTSTTNDDGDYALANLGQLKRVFSFDFLNFGRDADGDGMSDDMEQRWGLDPTVSNAFQNLPWFAGFEPNEGYVIGNLNHQKGWNVDSGSVVVQDQRAASGSQAVRCGSSSDVALAGASHYVVAGSNAVVWTDMKVKMLPGALSMMTNSYTNLAAVFTLTPNSYLAGYDGSMDDWVIASNSSKASRGAWLHLTVKQDYGAKKWSLYRNGAPVFIDLDFADKTVRQLTRIKMESSEHAGGYLDDLNVALGMFTHVDSDGDGIPNRQEDVNGNGAMDPTETDPFNADTDGDGMDDGQELALGFSATGYNSYSHLPWTSGFERSEGYFNDLLDGQQGWLASSSTVVQSSERYAGTNAARIMSSANGNAEMSHYVVGRSESVVWLEMYAKLQPGGLPDVETARSNSMLAAVNRRGILCAFHRELQSWVQAPAGYEVSPNAWTRLTARLDYAHKTWDMYVGSHRIFSMSPSRMRMFDIFRASRFPSRAAIARLKMATSIP